MIDTRPRCSDMLRNWKERRICSIVNAGRHKFQRLSSGKISRSLEASHLIKSHYKLLPGGRMETNCQTFPLSHPVHWLITTKLMSKVSLKTNGRKWVERNNGKIPIRKNVTYDWSHIWGIIWNHLIKLITGVRFSYVVIGHPCCHYFKLKIEKGRKTPDR